MSELNGMKDVNISLLLFSIMVTGFLLIGAIADAKRDKPFMKSFVYLLISNMMMQLGEVGIWWFDGKPEKAFLIKFCCILSFGVGALPIAFYIRCLLEFCRERKEISMLPAKIIMPVSIVFLGIVILSAWNGMFFDVNAQGQYVDGSYSFLVNIFDITTFILSIILVVRHRRLLSIRELISILSFGVFPVLSMSMVNIWYPTPEYLLLTLSLLLLLNLFHGELTRQLAEREKELLQTELELSESRVRILMSQIEPHFMFNSLSTIKHLCRTEPKEAMEAVDEFSGFLRGSMDALTQNGCITFEKEMEFVNSYLCLEKRRFGNRLQVVYDIQKKGFMVPPLSIQTIAENAVRHGISKKLSGGTLTIATQENEQNFIVSIMDDGVGFEMGKVSDDGKNHVGIHNVESRISLMCDGSVDIQSIPQKGTKVMFLIPKKEKTKMEGHDGCSKREGGAI